MPTGEVGRSVLGLTNIDGDGIAGLEKQYDEILTGVDGERIRDRVLVLNAAYDHAILRAAYAAGVDLGATPVVAGDNTTVHRRDCALIAHREDLRAVGNDTRGLVACRVCRP